ncbi:MAG TPA: hypothetical protein VFN31_03785 [Candidatus Saccharimonadales bacterium]|nr:hypothetical protein [Candidatus Saccharimonadales bacterium]
MSNVIINNRKTYIRPVYVLLLILCITYISLIYRDSIILRPSGNARAELLFISITVAVPEIIIWSIAILSSVKLKSYSRLIANSKDGRAMNYLADALFLMSAYIVLICSAYSITVLFKGSINLNKIVLLENYMPLAVALASAVLLALSARNFNLLIRRRISKVTTIVCSSIYLIVMAIFTWQFAGTHTKALTDDSIPRFVSSVKTLVYLYLLPQIILWALGLYACLNIAHYSRCVNGKIYKSLLADLYKGVLIVFICIFGAQVLMLTNFDLSKLSLQLILVYGLLLLGTVGFGLIYKGTNKLTKIEKI